MDDVRKINPKDFFKLKTVDGRIKFLLRYAILAPSTHNSQPWLFETSEDSCTVFYDPSLLLSEVDPKKRDLYISIGAAVENIVIAAKYFGIYKDIVYYPGNDKKVAKIVFNLKKPKADNKYQELLQAIVDRKNVRGKFENRSVHPTLINNVASILKKDYLGNSLSAFFVSNNDEIKEMATLTAKGMALAHSRKTFRREMSKWINNSFSKKRQGIPGYTMGMPALVSLTVPTMVKLFNMGKVMGKLNYKSFTTAPMVGVITAKKDNVQNWIETGRTAQRTFLELTSQGVKSSIYVASVEMGKLYEDLQKILKTDEIPQFLFVFGYMNEAQKYTLRHNFSKKMIQKI